MANLPEASQWDAVYQLETTDVVQGGAAGVDNAPLKNLTNRSLWNRDHALIDDTNPIGNYTVGQIFYAIGTKLLAKLGIGASNSVLTSSGSAPQWSTSLALNFFNALTAASAFRINGVTVFREVDNIRGIVGKQISIAAGATLSLGTTWTSNGLVVINADGNDLALIDAKGVGNASTIIYENGRFAVAPVAGKICFYGNGATNYVIENRTAAGITVTIHPFLL